MNSKLMRNIVLSLLFITSVVITLPVFGQYKFTDVPNLNSSPQYSNNDESPFDIDYNHRFITLNSDLNFNSNGITNDFMYQFYTGKFLDSTLKTKNLDRLKEKNNHLGFNWSTQLQINIPSKNRGFGYYAAFENHYFGELNYDENLFQLVFFGNKDLVDQNVSIDKQSFTLLFFQQIKAGVVKTWFGKSKVNVLTVGIGINNGQSLLNYDLPKATFFTQKEAEYISLDMEMQMHRSDTTSSKFGAENGLGLSLDASFYHREANYSIEINMQNLGFITWNKQSQQYKKDTLISFDGITIDNILNMTSTSIKGYSGDSIKNNFYYSKKSSRFTKMIPMRGSFNFTRYLLNNRLALSFTFINYHFAHYIPLFRFEPSWRFHVKKSFISIIPNIEYGGYGKLNYGLGLKVAINKMLFFEVKTDYLNGYLDLKHSAGLGGYVSIIKTL